MSIRPQSGVKILLPVSEKSADLSQNFSLLLISQELSFIKPSYFIHFIHIYGHYFHHERHRQISVGS